MKPSFALLLFIFSHACLAETIVLVADDWCPINCDPKHNQPGYAIEITSHIFQQAGHKVKYKRVPWSRALNMVNAGQAHGAIAATRQELPNGIFPKEPLGIYGQYFFAKENSPWRFNQLPSLHQIQLGAVKDYDYGPHLNQYIHNNRHRITLITGNDAVNRGLKMLLNNRIGAYLEDKNTALYYARHQGIEDLIKVVGRSGEDIPLYIGFSPKLVQSQYYAALLSKGIQDLRLNGKLDYILAKYGMKDWHPITAKR